MGSDYGQEKGRLKVYAFSDGLFLSRVIENTARGGRDGSALKSDWLKAAVSQGRYIYYVTYIIRKGRLKNASAFSDGLRFFKR